MLGHLAQTDWSTHPPANRFFRGIPFSLGPDGLHRKRYAAISASERSWSVPQLEIPLSGQARFICLAHFCEWDEHENPTPGPNLVEIFEKVGQHLAETTLVYEDGETATLPIRRRFEVSSPSVSLGQGCFAAQVHKSPTPAQLSDPLDNAMGWGDLQQGFVWTGPSNCVDLCSRQSASHETTQGTSPAVDRPGCSCCMRPDTFSGKRKSSPSPQTKSLQDHIAGGSSQC